MIDDIPEEMRGESATTDAHHLFDIAEYATKLSQTDADTFHHFVTQLLHLSKQAHSDIKLTVSLLSTRFRDHDNDD